jgi:hypothetical protein
MSLTANAIQVKDIDFYSDYKDEDAPQQDVAFVPRASSFPQMEAPPSETA